MAAVFVQYPCRFSTFREEEFIAHINNLYRLQNEINKLSKRAMWLIPGDRQTRFFPSTYYLTAVALSHILDRHYFKVPRYPDKSKFTIPVPEIVRYIRMAFLVPDEPISGLQRHRIMPTGVTIGRSHDGRPCQHIAVISDVYGYIRTAYPV